jgi:hypothetical protein
VLIGAIAGALAAGVIGIGCGIFRRAWTAGGILPIGSEEGTLQAHPLMITADGWLIDNRTGERARCGIRRE